MNFLLDTHTFLWFINGDNQLSQKAKAAILSQFSSKYLSIASLWEIAIKLSLGKIALKFSYAELQQQVIDNNFELLPVLFSHTEFLISLAQHHRDPFDRIIISQAIIENLAVISRNSNFTLYDELHLIW